MVLQAGRNNEPEQKRAMEELCRIYWYPVYAFIRRQGLLVSDAEDCAQEFFQKLIAGTMIEAVSREKGQFRSYLLACCKHFVSNFRDHQRAIKRGGQISFLQLDLELAETFYSKENGFDSAEHAFDRQWAVALSRHCQRLLEEDYQAAGKETQLTLLIPHLLDADAHPPFQEIAQKLETTPANVQVMLHRLRRKFRDILQREVRATLTDPAELKAEIRFLLSVLD
jgi:RNA polymerase sigma factor (sigma-70 family)